MPAVYELNKFFIGDCLLNGLVHSYFSSGDAQRRVNRATTGGRLAREVQDRQRAPRGQGGQPLTLRLNDQLGLT